MAEEGSRLNNFFLKSLNNNPEEVWTLGPLPVTAVNPGPIFSSLNQCWTTNRWRTNAQKKSVSRQPMVRSSLFFISNHWWTIGEGKGISFTAAAEILLWAAGIGPLFSCNRLSFAGRYKSLHCQRLEDRFIRVTSQCRLIHVIFWLPTVIRIIPPALRFLWWPLARELIGPIIAARQRIFHGSCCNVWDQWSIVIRKPFMEMLMKM